MKKATLLKMIAIFVGAAAVITGILLAVFHFSKSADSYRSILIYELEGRADIERKGTGTFAAAENLYLESGDRIMVLAESFMRLKLDDDKYIMVEENSTLSIAAAGTKEDSRTTIHLEQGAITNEIQNSLSPDSMYEVTTPNSVMAVRGTTFRVEILYDKDGEVYSKLSTFEGKVVCRLIYPDGTMDEEVPVDAGKEVIIHSNQDLTEYLTDHSDINYEDISMETLYLLQELMENGTQIAGIDREELDELIHRLEGNESPEDSEEPEDTQQAENTDASANTQTYTVTFVYQGAVFGTQSVQGGENAVRPRLSPTASGTWDFDFSIAINSNTTIEWKTN
ncbi:MAG: FecR family protein [Lachnospiraceae bacterium]|nr:FecR family protein [Lachnospiraceae bacterium]